MVNVSVIIPALNEEKTLPSLLNSLMPQLGWLDEVIVVDNNSVDMTPYIAEAYGCKVIQTSNMWSGLNQAVSLARNPIIVKTDADCVLPLTYISRVKMHYDLNPNLVGVTGPIADRNKTVFGSLIAELTNKLWRGVAANQSYRKEAFLKAGGYSIITFEPETLNVNDVRFWRKLSKVGETVYDPELKVETDFNTWKARTIPLLGIGAGTIITGLTLRKVDETRRILWNSLAGFGAGLILAEAGTKIISTNKTKLVKCSSIWIHHGAIGGSILLLSAFLAGVPIKNVEVRDTVASVLAGLGLGITCHDVITESQT